jgi:putative oxidoreductase
MNLKRILNLEFLPTSADMALLTLRAGLGLSMLLLHGWGKFQGFAAKADRFPDPLGVGHTASLSLTVFAEVLCAALLVVGFLTRFAATSVAITMGVAFFIVHHGKLLGEGNGELAFIYLIGAVALLIAGPGRYSLDRFTGGKI